MQTALNVAAVLAFATGLVHSVLGEWLIFRHLRRGTLVPHLGAPPLRARNIRILWATWHLASVFGWAFAALLFSVAASPLAPLGQRVLQTAITANGVGAVLVLIATRGRHPGWVALGAIAICAWAALGGA